MNPGATTELRETNRVFEEDVVTRGDFSALDRVYTRDARILPPWSEMITGRDRIQAFWRQTAAAMGVISVELRTIEAEFLGDTAIEIGRAVLTTHVAATEVKYVVVWKREDGVWKWDIDIWNPVT